MSKRVTLLVMMSILVLSLAGCGSEPAPTEDKAAAPAPPPKKEEPPAPVYDITKESLTDHADWTSRNVAILGAKIGDVTRNIEKNFGKLDNTRTLAEDYLTIYEDNGLFVYTFKLTGKIRRFEVYDTFSKKLADEKLKKLLTSGDLKLMRDTFGQEEKIEETADDPSTPATEYVYDARGFRFIQYKVKGKTLNALRFSEIKKSST